MWIPLSDVDGTVIKISTPGMSNMLSFVSIWNIAIFAKCRYIDKEWRYRAETTNSQSIYQTSPKESPDKFQTIHWPFNILSPNPKISLYLVSIYRISQCRLTYDIARSHICQSCFFSESQEQAGSLCILVKVNKIFPEVQLARNLFDEVNPHHFVPHRALRHSGLTVVWRSQKSFA